MNGPGPLRIKFEEMLLKGIDARDAAKRLNLTRNQEYRYRHLVKWKPTYKAISAISKARIDRGMNIGSVDEALRRERYDFGQWLVDQTPEGGCIADTLIAIAKDAYSEEKGE